MDLVDDWFEAFRGKLRRIFEFFEFLLSNRVKLVKIFHRSLIPPSSFEILIFFNLIEFMMILEAREEYRGGRASRIFQRQGKEKNP